MLLQFYKPSLELAPHVQAMMVFRDQTLTDTPILKPFPPATEQTLYFYPGNPPRNHVITQNGEAKIPFSTIVGPQTRRVNLSIQGDHLVIAVFFRPGGLQRLLGAPIPAVFGAEHVLDSAWVWPREIGQIRQQLAEAKHYPQMIATIEGFLLDQYRRLNPVIHRFEGVFERLLDRTHPVSIEYLADQSCLSPRHFERRFRERIGMSPKLFARISRFSQAFRLKDRYPQLSWLDVALQCRYYDFPHLVRDFREFADTTPTQLLEQEGLWAMKVYTGIRLNWSDLST
ncbi:MAG: AraC family transcriptional regulator [Spirosoma sp.]|nr:AraC family transcriptional regulator [Spirosoma sp.]